MMTMQQAVEIIRAKHKQAKGIGQSPLGADEPNMPEMDLSGVRQMPEMDLSQSVREMPAMDLTDKAPQVAKGEQVGDDVVQMDGEPSIHSSSPAPATSSPLANVLKMAQGATRQPLAPQDAAPEPVQASGNGSLDDAIAATKRNRGLVTIGEAISARTNRPRHLLDFAITKAGGHPEPMAQDPFVGQAQASADQPMAEYAAHAKAAADASAKQRQTGLDVLNARKGESEIEKNKAEAYKAMHPEPKPPHEPLFDPLAFKTGMKADPVFMKEYAKQFNGDAKKAAAAIDALPNDKETLTKLSEHSAGQGKGLTLAVAGAQLGLGKEETAKQSEERTKINTARRQLNSVQDAFHNVSPIDIAKGKVGWDSPAMSEFRSSALALIDKMAQVETGASGRQSQVEQWKHIIEGNSVVTNDQMDAIAKGLRGALDAAQEENEGRTQGLPQLRAAAPAPEKTVHFYEPSKGDFDIPANLVERFKKEHPDAKETP
jgi:hypothetical protein